MNFKIYSNISSVKKIWLGLEKIIDIGLYQTYEMNKLYYKARRASGISLKDRNLIRNRKSIFIVGFCDNQAVCLAPLNIDEYPHKVIRLLGHGTNVGMLDFLYKEEKYVDELWNYIRKRYSDYSFEFIFVPEYSPLIQKLQRTETFENFRINVDGYEDYFSTLSKHARQNIRTAYNRIEKDHHNFRIEILTSDDKKIEEVLDNNIKLYKKRRREWLGSTGSIDSVVNDRRWKKIRDMTAKIMEKKRDIVLRGMLKLTNSEMVTLYIDNQNAAFFIGFKEKNKGEIHIPRLAINTDFSRYSPGMIMICEYLKKRDSNFVFDLGRGAETYKKDLGGKLYLSYRLISDYSRTL